MPGVCEDEESRFGPLRYSYYSSARSYLVEYTFSSQVPLEAVVQNWDCHLPYKLDLSWFMRRVSHKPVKPATWAITESNPYVKSYVFKENAKKITSPQS